MSELASSFIEAVYTNNSEAVQLLIDNASFDINSPLPILHSPPPLVLAINHSRIKIAEMLLRANANVDICDDKGSTPCHAAALYCSNALLLLLLYRPKLDVKSRVFGYAPIHYACDGNPTSLRYLITAGANINEPTSRVDWTSLTDRTPLHIASFVTNSTECVLILLAAGADVNSRDSQGKTPLHWSSTTYRFSAAHALLAAGADFDAADNSGEKVRHVFSLRRWTVNHKLVETYRKAIVKERLDFVRYRALQVCISLQPLRFDALCTCEVLFFACGPVAPLILFHQWWTIATIVKHFHN